MINKDLFSLGLIYPSDFLKPDEEPRCEPIELKLVMDENGTVCLEKYAPNDVMWGERYWYRSSTNETMKRQLKDVVDSALEVFHVPMGSAVLDIASNDGYLLSCIPSQFIRIGVDPVGGTIAEEAKKHADLIIQDYFSAEVFSKFLISNKPKLIFCISMFYDLDEPGKFLDDLHEIMDDDALLVLQLSHSPLMIKQMEFSNLCHEHRRYYSFFNLHKLLREHKFWVMDATLNNTNSGSIRLHIMKDSANHNLYCSQTHRDVCDFRMESLMDYEFNLGMHKPETWIEFYESILELKEEAVTFIKMEKAKGKIIYAYGASTKGHTLLSFFGLDNTIISAVADKNPDKHGLRMVGTNIKIISEEQFRLDNPDYLLVLPVHFLNEFMIREKEYLEGGGKMIVCMPSFQIIEK